MVDNLSDLNFFASNGNRPADDLPVFAFDGVGKGMPTFPALRDIVNQKKAEGFQEFGSLNSFKQFQVDVHTLQKQDVDGAGTVWTYKNNFNDEKWVVDSSQNPSEAAQLNRLYVAANPSGKSVEETKTIQDTLAAKLQSILALSDAGRYQDLWIPVSDTEALGGLDWYRNNYAFNIKQEGPGFISLSSDYTAQLGRGDHDVPATRMLLISQTASPEAYKAAQQLIVPEAA